MATRQVDDPEAVSAVSRRAYRDINRTLHGIVHHPDAERLHQHTHESLHQFLTNLHPVSSQQEFDDRHEQWCHATLNRYGPYTRPTSQHPPPGVRFHYGQAQKWLNMALKYLAVLGHPALPAVYPFLHVPVDEIIYTQAVSLGVSRPRRAGASDPTAWSRLTQDEYLDYQHRLRAAIRHHYGPHYPPLNWEAAAWATRAPMAH